MHSSPGGFVIINQPTQGGTKHPRRMISCAYQPGWLCNYYHVTPIFPSPTVDDFLCCTRNHLPWMLLVKTGASPKHRCCNHVPHRLDRTDVSPDPGSVYGFVYRSSLTLTGWLPHPPAQPCAARTGSRGRLNVSFRSLSFKHVGAWNVANSNGPHASPY